MKNILVPIDFSDASHNAAQYAVSFAKFFEATVTCINVVAPPLMVVHPVLASVTMTQAEIVDYNKRLMANEIESFSKECLSDIQGFVREGQPSDIIHEMAAEIHSELIIMGMKGKGKSNLIFGSTTTAVVRKVIVPVLVIPEKADYHNIDTITFATDFDPETKNKCYSLLIDLAKKYDSTIHILNVQKDKMKLKKNECVGKIRTDYTFTGTKHVFNTIEDRKVIEGINEFIKDNPSDLLAMMAHKHSFFERMVGKVHTKEMSYQTKIPLLILQNK